MVTTLCLRPRSDRRQRILGKAGRWRGRLLYGFGHLGKSLFWYSSELLFAYFLTEFVGLRATQMGVVLASGFLVSALIDLSVGVGLARRLTTASSASQLQFIGAVLCSIALLAVFLGAWIAPAHRFAYAMAAGGFFRLAFAIYDIPQNALMALATGDATARLRIASTRIWFSGTATLIVATLIGPLVSRRDDASATQLLLGVAILFGIVAIVGAWMLHRLLRATVREVPQPSVSEGMRGPWPAAFWWLLLVMVATSAFTPVFSKLEPYFAAYALGSAWWGGVVIVSMASGILVGQPVWIRLCVRMPGGSVMLANALLQIAALVLFCFSGVANPAVSAFAAFLFGLRNGGVGMVQWAAFSETVVRLGTGRTGLGYGLFSAAAKLSFAVGGLLIATALDRIDYRGGQGADIVPLMASVPIIGAVFCALAGVGLLRRNSLISR